MPERNRFHTSKLNEKFIDIHDFTNANDVIEQEKPDLILASPSFNFIDLAFSIAGKNCNIPVVTIINPNLMTNMMPVKNTFSLFFHNNVANTELNKKSFMRRGNFLLSKYFFLHNTQKKSGRNILKIFKNNFLMLKLYFNHIPLVYHLNFEMSYCCVANNSIYQKLISAGIDSSKIEITGIPMYDKLFKKFKEISKTTDSSKKQTLFAPEPLYEHGYISKSLQDKIIKNTIEEILNLEGEFELTLKIHPHASNLEEYKTLVNQFNVKIPIFQKGDILDYLASSDILITFPGITTTLNAVLLRIPTVIINFLHTKNDPFVNNSLATECVDLKDLSKIITQIKAVDQINLDKFIEEFFYKADGNASKRICKKF